MTATATTASAMSARITARGVSTHGLRSVDSSARTDALAGSRGVRLTPREREVRAVSGKANKVIARELGLSEGTIKAHLSSIFRAIGVSNRTEAVCHLAKVDADAKRLF